MSTLCSRITYMREQYTTSIGLNSNCLRTNLNEGSNKSIWIYKRKIPIALVSKRYWFFFLIAYDRCISMTKLPCGVVNVARLSLEFNLMYLRTGAVSYCERPTSFNVIA